MKTDMINSLTKEHGFLHVDVEATVRGEAERGTVVGQELSSLIGTGQVPSNELLCKMLSQILYCGKDDAKQFILSNYPGTNEQAENFEKNCATLGAIIYPTTQVEGQSTIELKNKDITMFNMDSLMNKQFRLKIMTEWSNEAWDNTISGKTQYGIIIGKSLSGKSEVAKAMGENQAFTVLDHKAIADQVKARLGSEEEPFEGEVPLAEIEKDICKQIMDGKNSTPR